MPAVSHPTQQAVQRAAQVSGKLHGRIFSWAQYGPFLSIFVVLFASREISATPALEIDGYFFDQ
jgi:hypothetical protein